MNECKGLRHKDTTSKRTNEIRRKTKQMRTIITRDIPIKRCTLSSRPSSVPSNPSQILSSAASPYLTRRPPYISRSPSKSLSNPSNSLLPVLATSRPFRLLSPYPQATTRSNTMYFHKCRVAYRHSMGRLRAVIERYRRAKRRRSVTGRGGKGH